MGIHSPFRRMTWVEWMPFHVWRNECRFVRVAWRIHVWCEWMGIHLCDVTRECVMPHEHMYHVTRAANRAHLIGSSALLIWGYCQFLSGRLFWFEVIVSLLQKSAHKKSTKCRDGDCRSKKTWVRMYLWMNHVTWMSSCRTWMSDIAREWVMSHMIKLCRTWMSSVAHDWVMSPMNKSCRTWMSHVAHEWVMSHMNESCHTWMSHVANEWVMSRMDESCHV